MAVSLEALLKIVARVQGEGAVGSLSKAIGGIGRQATAASGALRGLAGAAGMNGLAGAMGALTPLLSAAGLAGMAKAALASGDAMLDMSEKTGVSVEMLGKFKKAATLSGTNIDAVVAGLGRLSKAMVASAAVDMGGKTKDQVEESVKALEDGGERQVRAVEKSSDRQVKAVEDRADQQVKAVEDQVDQQVKEVERGEKEQTDAIEEETERRIDALSDETERRMRELRRRYKQEEKLQNDSFDDQRDRIENALDEQTDQVVKNAQRVYNARRKAIQDNESLSEASKDRLLQQLEDGYDREIDIIRDNAAAAKKVRDRAARDQRDALDQDREDRMQAEEDAIKKDQEAKQNAIKKQGEQQIEQVKENAEAQKKVIKDQAEAQTKIIKDQAEAQKAIIKERTTEMVSTIKDGIKDAVAALKADTGKSAIADEMESMGLNGKAASEAFRQMGINVKDAAGNMRPTEDVMLDISNYFKKIPDGATKSALAMKLFGRAGLDMIPMLNMGGDAIQKLSTGMTTGFAKAANAYGDKLDTLGMKIGGVGLKIAKLLLPVLDTITTALIGFFDWLDKQNPIVQGIITVVGTLTVAFAALLPIIIGIGAAVSGIMTIVATIGPALGVVAAVVAGFITWPVLLVAGLVAAGIAIIAFRDQIGAFFGWLGGIAGSALAAFGQTLYQLFVVPFIKAWTNLRDAAMAGFQWLRDGWQSFSDWVGGIFDLIGQAFARRYVDPITAAFSFVVETGKAALRGLLGWVAGAVNRIINLMNDVIAGYNRLPGPDIGFIPNVQVPAFAQGGYVTGPTVGLIGEAGSEYVIPASRMAAASANYLAGARGAAVLTGGGGAGGPIIVNIETGPIMQSGGQDWVTRADMTRAVSEAVRETRRALLSPGGRAEMGMA